MPDTSADMSKRAIIYSDGACSPNPGVGGWGVVVLLPGLRRELSGGETETTNNRMELTGAIRGLEILPSTCHVKLHTDSQYVCNAFKQSWIAKWKRNGWRTRGGKPVLNTDLWKQLIELTEIHTVEWTWVRGHSGDPENERADELAVQARLRIVQNRT